MAKYQIKIRSKDAGGGSEFVIQTPGARWILDDGVGISMQAWNFSPPYEVKIRRLETHGSRLYIERNVGDGAEWELTCAIEANAPAVSIRSNRQAGGNITVSSPVDSFTHGPQASPLVENLRLA